MSTFLVPNDSFTGTRTTWHDDRVRDPAMTWNVFDRTAQVRPWGDAILWPSSRFSGGDPSQSLYLFNQDSRNYGRFEHISTQLDDSGTQTAMKFRGVTRDSAGNPLGSVTIQVFRTSDDLYVSQTVSDAGGYYEAVTPYIGVNHYLVAYKPGSPDVVGTTVNTLQPSW